jgi:hypothetical protein
MGSSSSVFVVTRVRRKRMVLDWRIRHHYAEDMAGEQASQELNSLQLAIPMLFGKEMPGLHFSTKIHL